MRVFSEITTHFSYSRSIQFEKEYFERYTIYKQVGGFLVDFELKILPTQNSNITVYSIGDQQTETCIEYIFEGIERFIELKNSEGIGIKPFEIIIGNAIIHPVDFKPQKHVAYTCKRLNEISFEIGKKEVLTLNKEINLKENIEGELAFDNKNFPSISLSNYSILLPNRKLQKLVLPLKFNCEKELIIEESYRPTKSINLLIKENDYGFRHINRIAIVFDEISIGINSFISIIDGIKKFVDDVYKSNYDIGGFTIYISNANITVYEAGFSEKIYWFLKELMISNNDIYRL